MSLALVSTGRSLDELSELIAEEHREVQRGVVSALEHAIRAGDHLLEARGIVPFGEWDIWLAERALEWNLSIEWARSYMRLSRFQELLRDEEVESIGSARKLLRMMNTKDVRYDPVLRKECVRLRKAGKLHREIADELGVSKPTVSRWLNPRAEHQYRIARAQTSRAGRAAMKARERANQARKVGGDLGEAYSLLRRTLDTLERASAQHTGETRRGIRSAMNSLYNAEDSLAAAIRKATS